MRRSLALLVVGMFLVPSVIGAQAVQAGARVRVKNSAVGTRTGTLVALAPDTLVVRWDGADSSRLPLDQVSRLDVSRGMHRRVLSRMGGGFAIGAGGGALIGLAAGASDDCSGEIFCPGPGGGAIIGGIFFGVAGALVGAATGLSASEQWERVPLSPRQIRVALPAQGRPASIGLAVAF